MRARWVIGLLLGCSSPQLQSTEAPELVKSLSRWDEQEQALQALDVLLDPQHPPTIGQSCSVGGVRPPGRKAVDDLVAMKRGELLARALTAPTPEGRLYATIGLARLGAIRWGDVDARAATENDVEVCFGCIVQRVSATEALDYVRGCAALVEE